MKQCLRCHQLLNIENFCKDKSRSDGFNPRCRSCKSILDKEYRNNNKDKINKVQQEYYQNNKETIKQKVNTWYKDNKQKQHDKMKQYYQNNKEKIQETKKKWNEENKHKMQEYINTYIKERYQSDHVFKTKCILRARLRSCIKSKSNMSSVLLGCSIEQFMDWIEYQFDHHMIWENHGSYWHFDHVIPCSSFNLVNENEIEQCFNWKNIRPLEAKMNLSKNNKVLQHIIDEHQKVVKEFEARRTQEHQVLSENNDLRNGYNRPHIDITVKNG